MGPFKCYVTQWGVGGCQLSRKKRYAGVRFNVISVTRGWVGVKFPGKKRYVTREWPLCTRMNRRCVGFIPNNFDGVTQQVANNNITSGK